MSIGLVAELWQVQVGVNWGFIINFTSSINHDNDFVLYCEVGVTWATGPVKIYFTPILCLSIPSYYSFKPRSAKEFKIWATSKFGISSFLILCCPRFLALLALLWYFQPVFGPYHTCMTPRLQINIDLPIHKFKYWPQGLAGNTLFFPRSVSGNAHVNCVSLVKPYFKP